MRATSADANDETARAAKVALSPERRLDAIADILVRGLARLWEIETEADHLRIQLGEVEDRLRALTGAQRQVERVARLLDGFGTLWGATSFAGTYVVAEPG